MKGGKKNEEIAAQCGRFTMTDDSKVFRSEPQCKGFKEATAETREEIIIRD